MGFEHQARIIGMGLLLGEIPFKGLVDGWRARLSADGELDLEALLEDLHRQGLLRTETLESLHAQVIDLERLITEGSAPPPNEPTAESRIGSAPREASPALPAADSRTPSWLGAAPQTGDAEEDLGSRLLSVLTLPRWNQFVNLKFLGEGGMGRIFKAFDPKLNRQVALKFLRWSDSNTIGDLIQEARNQAQVDHPNICKVYEVKEWRGQAYVVMQFIDGKTLDQIAPQLEDLEKVELMERVAEAVHAAHRQGLIHRDLKPANIMVERDPEGALIPYVLDFGLARNLGRNHHTEEGTIQGTAHYMAPEQARGDSERIERRTDVYALGVTLYELFAGAPPFSEYPGIDCLRHILESDVPPLRALNPRVAADLQTIVMKCLEKDIPRRYESARALAEDLRRFRDGEPILARPASLGYRIGKLARKYRAFVALGAAALLIVIAFATVGIHARVTAASRAHWAQHFGQEAERIEALLRYARLQPPHDIRGELATVMERIQAMESEVNGAGAQAQGPGHYALGRAYLALGETAQAQAHLDRAWAADFRGRDVAYARGRALSQAYAKAMDTARAIQDPQLRRTRIQELEESLRAPAVALLREGQGSLLDPPGFQEGLLALYDQRFGESLRLARSAHSRAPWFYEALRLEGEVHLERARQAQDPPQVFASLEQAGRALAAAATIAPSDPELWDLQSRRWWEEMTAARHGGTSPQQAFLHLEAACESWKRLLPEAPEPDARRAWGEIERARSRSLQEAALPQALRQAEALAQRFPNDPGISGALAAALQLRAYADFNHGRDPRADLDRAIALLQRALATEGASFELIEPYVACFWARIEFEKAQGKDPVATVQRALESLQEIASRHPKVADFEGFLGGLQVELADYQSTHGTDPEPVALRALGHLERAIRLAPARFEFHFSAGNAHLACVQYLVLHRQPAWNALDEAERAYRSALQCNASARGAMVGLGEVRLLRSRALDQVNRSPLETLAQAEATLAPLRNQTDNWRLALFSAQAELLRARWSAEPRAGLEAAERLALRALKLGGRGPESLLVLAKIQLAWARQFPSEARPRRARAQSLLQEIHTKDAAFEPGLLAESSR